MSSNATIGKRVTFGELFGEVGQVEIPIIQRDYAQGREGQEELRGEFLAALKGALEMEPGDRRLPLDLDFVYGSSVNLEKAAARKVFAPLDGQQRLTTLFLLHWYLAWQDGESGDFKERFLKDRQSLFSYSVRPGSHDFFNKLVQHFPEENPAGVVSLGMLLQDRNWFFRSWLLDPTIVSAITMLEDIHRIFKGCSGCYAKLLDPAAPRITFHLLELEYFGLSDDLYIKMNARGKPLTPFENFKARLEQHLDQLLPDDPRVLHGREVSVGKYFAHRMDTTWTDLFWNRPGRVKDLFDAEAMNLLRAVALAFCDPARETAAAMVAELRGPKATHSFPRFQALDCLNPRMLRGFIALLDFWSGNPDPAAAGALAKCHDTRAAFWNATDDELSYPDQVKFSAQCRHVAKHGTEDLAGLADWCRVIHNLAENTPIDSEKRLLDALGSLDELEPQAESILAWLEKGGEVKFFNRRQVREERVKARLLTRGGSWRELIYTAEQHPYFAGQIGFLLEFAGVPMDLKAGEDFAWDEAGEKECRDKFADYYKKADAIFGDGGLRFFEDFLWERALLSLGDYTVPHSANKSLLDNIYNTKERRPTWRTMLEDADCATQRAVVRKALDRVDLELGVEKSLQAIIDDATPGEDWRRLMAGHPGLIGYCGQRMFRIEGGGVYLISKVRTSSEWVELMSYDLYLGLLDRMEEAGELAPFNVCYDPVNGEQSWAGARLAWPDQAVNVEIYFEDDKWDLRVSGEGQEAKERIVSLLEKMGTAGIGDDGEPFVGVAAGEIGNVIRELVGLARGADM